LTRKSRTIYFLIKSAGKGEKVLNDYKALRNTSLTPPSEVPKKTDATKAPTRLKAKIASPITDRPNHSDERS